MSVARHSLRVATLNSIGVFTQESVHSNVRYAARLSHNMPLSRYTDGSIRGRDHTTVNGVSMNLFVRLFLQFTKSHAKLESLVT
jgi:hypothetical protein